MKNHKYFFFLSITTISLLFGSLSVSLGQGDSKKSSLSQNDSQKKTSAQKETLKNTEDSDKKGNDKSTSTTSTQTASKEATSEKSEATNSSNQSKQSEGSVGKTAESDEKKQSTNTKIDPEKSDDWVSNLINWVLYGLAGVVILAAIVAGIFFLRRNKQREREEIAQNFQNLSSSYRKTRNEIEELKKVLTNLSHQISQQKKDISRLGQATASSQQPTTFNNPSLLFSEPQFDEPVSQFPMSVDDYLAKVSRGAVPVKYDYKERMLVQDAERDGGLLIVRDDSTIDGFLYLIPSFGFFQTKSDYTNYFERYYACAKPMGGTVWIRQPATVSQINGGWQLSRQGELEVK